MDLNVLIVGGGIHGVGLLHDLATRGLAGVHLVEQSTLAAGTSSRTTKLIHGGLRYLEHPGQWGLVREALSERALLLRLLPGIVQPIPFILPAFRQGRSAWLIRLGLALYDQLASGGGLPRSRRLTQGEIARLAPYFRRDQLDRGLRDVFLYYDAQMLDDVIVRLAARAASRLGATYAEQTRVEAITHVSEGYRVRLRSPNGAHEVTGRLVVNAAGAWANANLLRWNVRPRTVCLLNVGTHLVFSPDVVPAKPDDCAATLMQHADGRVVFFIPWDKKWMLGTTDSMLDGTPDRWDCPAADRVYLMEIAKQHLELHQPDRHILETFCGIRTIPLPDRAPAAGAGPVPSAWSQDPFASPFYRRLFKGDASSLSRESVLDESASGLFTIYGGKFTTYRALCKRLGDRIAQRLGHGGTSGTHDPRNWFLDELRRSEPHLFQSSAELRRNPC